MGYNRELEDRIDRLSGRYGGLTKKRMFGGIGYLINGNICFGIHKQLLVLRISPEKADLLMKGGQAMPFDITGRPMKGWVVVSPDVVKTDEKLNEMLQLGASFGQTLPEKK